MGNDDNKKVTDSRLTRLEGMITDLREEPVLSLLKKLLIDGLPPTELLNSCLEGMRHVGKRFEGGRYFISALVMAGEIMRQALQVLGPHLSPADTRKTQGRVVLATVQGDIHDLGKNLFAGMLHFDGVEVVDLGVDVPPEEILTKIRSVMPTMVGLSCVLTSCLSGLRETVTKIREISEDKRPPVIIGGACVDKKIREFVGADYWATDVGQGLNIYRKIFREGTKSSADI